ncbi:relaxase/mobilization nuclease domain-containing protein [Larkinella insperata]|uniref:Relaxase/mobilization nuclease domain-containing protein n=1 Tax=Larkinella insperata TaxID=332158 RepID=A0ABW3QCG9_9BACT
MVARISSGSNPRGAVYYNEEKVEKGEAERLSLRNYLGIMADPEQMKKQQVAYVLEQQAALNERITKPTFHVSLSLAPGEKPDANELLSIADQYMIGMGYGLQPYAVYQHFDTDHTHVHIVSIRVDEEGKKLSDKFERERSNKLRQQIEQDFGLKEAERAVKRLALPDLKPVHYGQGDLKQAVTNVVLTVLNDYRFSSMAQYNQLLGLYNVKALEVPLEGKKPGLVYTVANEQERQGVGFKASSIRQQPTRETVERRMKSGKKIKEDSASRLRKAIDGPLTTATGWVDFQQKLQRTNVLVMPHQGKDGNLFGVSFLDIKQKAIYSGSELGKSFAAAALKNKLGETFERAPKEDTSQSKERVLQPKSEPSQDAPRTSQQPEPSIEENTSLLRQLLYAAGYGDDQQESEQELKKMTRKLKPRL